MLKRQLSEKKKVDARTASVPPPSGKPAVSMRPAWMGGILFIFAFVLYANTLSFKYALDDALVITENDFTREGIKGLGPIFTNDSFTGFFGMQKKLVAGGRYRPLSQAVFAVQYEFLGLNPFAGHLLNILLYALCGILISKLLLSLLPPRGGGHWLSSLPFLAAAIFIAHPLHTEVVANIKGLDEILSLLFSLICLYLAIEYADKKNIWALILSVPAFLLALLSKENAITFLAVIPLCLYFFRSLKTGTYLLLLSAPVIATAIYLGMRYNALGYLTSQEKITELLNDPYVGASVAERFATNIYTWGKYILLLIFPHPLTHDYYPKQIPIIGPSDVRFLISFAVYAALAAYALVKLRRRTLLSFGLLFFFITFSISSNVVFNIGTFMNERFLFIPLLGFAIIVAWLISTRLSHQVATAVIVVLLAAYSVKTFSRNFAWYDDYTLFTTDVETSSNSAKCNVSAGGVILVKAADMTDSIQKAAMLNKAEGYLLRALQIYPGNSAGWVLLGNVYLARKDYDKAQEYYINCLRIHPGQQEATGKLNYVGQKMAQLEKFQEGIAAFRLLHRIDPSNATYRIQLADILSKTGRADTAVVMLETMIREDLDPAGAYSKLGEIHGRVYGDIVRAEALLQKAYSINPNDISTLENLGIVYSIQQQSVKAIEFLNRALALDTANPRILSNLATAYNAMGDLRTAETYRLRSLSARERLNARNP